MLQIVITLEIYGVKKIVGIPFGYRGFSDTSLSEMPVSIIYKSIVYYQLSLYAKDFFLPDVLSCFSLVQRSSIFPVGLSLSQTMLNRLVHRYGKCCSRDLTCEILQTFKKSIKVYPSEMLYTNDPLLLISLKSNALCTLLGNSNV